MSITLKERMALLMAGYSKKEIKEFEAQEAQEIAQTTTQTEAEPSDPAPGGNTSAEGAPTATPTSVDDSSINLPSGAPSVAEEVDYKSLYEKAQKDLATLQAENRNRDVSSNIDNNSDEDTFNAFVEGFLSDY